MTLTFRHVVAIGALSLLASDSSVPQPIAGVTNVHRTVVPALQAPSGSVVRVSTEQELQTAVADLSSGQTILIAPGTYHLTRTLYVGGRELINVALRGASARREDVTLLGRGMESREGAATPFGIWTGNGTRGLLVANLTIQGFSNHAVIFNSGTESPHLYNVALLDAGQQLLKSNPDSRGTGVNNAVVEYSLFGYSLQSLDGYTNGIDVHGGANWMIRHNTFVNIRAPRGQLAGPAILMWRRSSGTIVDGNTFVNCQREVSVGLEPGEPSDRMGSIIRNNMITREPWVHGDAAVLVASPNTEVLHNTILIGDTYHSAIEYRFPNTTNVLVANNLTDRDIVARDGARATVHDNVTSAERKLFIDPSHGDLHLRPPARATIGRGEWMSDADVDGDDERRPRNSEPAVGADE